jgi:hypothetical protein
VQITGENVKNGGENKLHHPSLPPSLCLSLSLSLSASLSASLSVSLSHHSSIRLTNAVVEPFPGPAAAEALRAVPSDGQAGAGEGCAAHAEYSSPTPPLEPRPGEGRRAAHAHGVGVRHRRTCRMRWRTVYPGMSRAVPFPTRALPRAHTQYRVAHAWVYCTPPPADALPRREEQSKVRFVSGQAKSGPKKAELWRAITFQGFGMAKM